MAVACVRANEKANTPKWRYETVKKPVVDPDLCTSCGVCVEVCPGVFELGPDDIAVVKNPSGASEDEIQEAIDSCPGEAISWSE